MGKNSNNKKILYCPEGKKNLGLGRSPPQELEESLRSGPYLLVLHKSCLHLMEVPSQSQALRMPEVATAQEEAEDAVAPMAAVAGRQGDRQEEEGQGGEGRAGDDLHLVWLCLELLLDCSWICRVKPAERTAYDAAPVLFTATQKQSCRKTVTRPLPLLQVQN